MTIDGKPDWADYARDPRDQFWDEQARHPRGFGPPWNGDDAPSELGWDDIYTDDEEPGLLDDMIHDPGFSEHEVDDHHDPDHGREEDHRTGAILRQSEQWPQQRVSGFYEDYPELAHGERYELDRLDKATQGLEDVRRGHDHEANMHDPSTQEAWQAHVMKNQDTGLGYDVLVKRNPKGDGWDVIRPLP